jgi:hypothetical protein
VVGQLAEARSYKAECHGFESQWVHGVFSLIKPHGRTMALESIQCLTERRTRSISKGVKADGATSHVYSLHAMS